LFSLFISEAVRLAAIVGKIYGVRIWYREIRWN